MALIAAFHKIFGSRLVPESRVRLHPDEWFTFDPSKVNVPQVLAYLEKVGPAERARVFELERNGQKRKTVLAEEARLTGDPDAPAGDDLTATVDALDDAVHDHQTPDAAGAGDTNPAGDIPGTSTEA